MDNPIDHEFDSKKELHEENRENQRHMHDHENQHADNNNNGAGRNPIHHDIGNK